MAETARLRAVALISTGCARPVAPGRVMEPPAELRDDVLEAHVGAVDVVRPEDQDALEILAAVIDRHQLAQILPPP